MALPGIVRPGEKPRALLVVAVLGFAGVGALCLAALLWAADPAIHAAEAAGAPAQARARPFRPAPRITFDPDFTYEARTLGPAQQFEFRLRLVLPSNQHGYGFGLRRTVSAEEAAMGRFLRMSARLPGLAHGPRPRIELSIISRDS
jgi:hypothetical protein